MEEVIIKCSNCGNEIKEDEPHCLSCNSINKTIVLNFEDNLTLKNQLSGKGKDYSKRSKKRQIIHFVSGSEQSNNGDWVEKEFLVDKNENLYKEQIIDEEGKVIHSCSHKLTDHIGHGSAKFSKKK